MNLKAENSSKTVNKQLDVRNFLLRMGYPGQSQCRNSYTLPIFSDLVENSHFSAKGLVKFHAKECDEHEFSKSLSFSQSQTVHFEFVNNTNFDLTC